MAFQLWMIILNKKIELSDLNSQYTNTLSFDGFFT